MDVDEGDEIVFSKYGEPRSKSERTSI